MSDRKIQRARKRVDRLRARKREKPKGKRYALKNLIAAIRAQIDKWLTERKRLKPVQVPLPSAGSFTGGGKKVCWHTSEGPTAEGCISAVRSANAAPHFTFEPFSGRLFQHIPFNQAARALAHPSGPETNRANVIQVELVGYAAETGLWSDEEYVQVAKLARWIESEFGVPRKSAVSFDKPSKLSGQDFYDYSGHCGHVHVPGNNHSDPGSGFKIAKVI